MGVSRHIPAAPESPNTRAAIKGICLCAATRTGPQSRQKHRKKHEHMAQHFPAWQTATANTFGDKIRLGKQSWRKTKPSMNSESISAQGHWNICYVTSPGESFYFFFSDRSAKVKPTSRNTQLQVKMKVHYSDQQIFDAGD